MEFPCRMRSTVSKAIIDFESEKRGVIVYPGNHLAYKVGETIEFVSLGSSDDVFVPAEDFLTEEELDALCDPDIMGFAVGPNRFNKDNWACKSCKQRKYNMCGYGIQAPVMCGQEAYYYLWEPIED